MNKTALITGASGGIGQPSAKRLGLGMLGLQECPEEISFCVHCT